MHPTQCKVSVHKRKDLTEHQLSIMYALFIKTRAVDPHFQMKAKQRARTVEQYLSEKFTKSINGKEEDALYFFILTSASSSFFLSFCPSSFSTSEVPDPQDLIGFTIAERIKATTVYVSRTTIDPRVQNAGLGKTMANTLRDYFEDEIIWGFVNEKQKATRRFWEVLGAKETPASALPVGLTRTFKDYVIYAYRAKL
jgi:hypothetical protein